MFILNRLNNDGKIALGFLKDTTYISLAVEYIVLKHGGILWIFRCSRGGVLRDADQSRTGHD